MDRKEILKKLSEFLGTKPKYLGPPSFAYEVRAEDEIYIIDRYGNIITSEGRAVTLDEILNPNQPITEEQHEAEAETEHENVTQDEEETPFIDGVELKLPMEGHTGATLQNMVNMLSSKQNLIMKALEMTEAFMNESFAKDLSKRAISTMEDFKIAVNELTPERCPGLTFDFVDRTFSFRFMAENIGPDTIAAFQDLVVLMNENAKKLKHASFKQAQDDNPKYAFRTWLIRLGMNGSEYKTTRKVLLSNLEGSGAFRRIPGQDE